MSKRNPKRLWQTKAFPRDQLLEILDDEDLIERDRIVDHTRWSVVHELIFKEGTERLYRVLYNVPATECQDESPWQYQNMVTCTEVKPVRKSIVDYDPVEKE